MADTTTTNVEAAAPEHVAAPPRKRKNNSSWSLGRCDRCPELAGYQSTRLYFSSREQRVCRVHYLELRQKRQEINARHRALKKQREASGEPVEQDAESVESESYASEDAEYDASEVMAAMAKKACWYKRLWNATDGVPEQREFFVGYAMDEADDTVELLCKFEGSAFRELVKTIGGGGAGK